MFFKKNKWPELYSEKEIDIIESHIAAQFGAYETVFHEIVSPDIHVDICFIPPTDERNYITLVTMGMGAHKMNVPRQLRKKGFERAEIVVTLPPDWDVNNEDERWYWPIRWLKTLARLPIEHNTWLGYGHTISNEAPLAENNEFFGIMLTMPYFFGNEAATCKLSGKDTVVFYQMIPIYENEMQYKNNNSAEDLENLFPEDFNLVVDINRKSMVNDLLP